MVKIQIFLTCLFVVNLVQASEVIENGDFSKARIHWKIEGKDDMTLDLPPLLKITLNDHKWSKIEQELKLSDEPSNLEIKIELQPSDDFKPEEKSKEYANLDWAMGGQYGWTAFIFPKSDCLIIVENQGSWEYRLMKLKPGESQTIRTDCKKIKSKKSVLIVAFPPGTGSVIVKTISVDMSKAP